MRLRNAFRLLIYNFSNVYKLLLFRLATNVVTICLVYVVVSLGLHAIFTSAEAKALVDLVEAFFRALVSGNVSFLASFQNRLTAAATDFLALLGANVGSIVGAIAGVCLLYLVSRFLNGTAVFAMGDVINGKMETYGKTSFGSAYFRNVGKAALYQIVYVPLSFVYNLLALLACWFFFLYTPSFLPSWGVLSILIGLSLSMAAYICLQALKLTFVSAWIPAILAGGKKVGQGMKESFCRLHGFGGRFSTYLIAIFLTVAFNALFGVFTLGSMLLVTVPASYLLFVIVQFVYYYEDTDKKYFLSFRTISGADGKPESMGD